MRSVWRGLRTFRRAKIAAVLVIAALLLVFTTFVVLAGGMSLTHRPQVEAVIFSADFIILVLLAATVALRWRRMLAERRTGLAGARLHVRLITLFGVVSVVPAVIIGILAALFFHFGIQIWFSQRVNTALTEARDVAAGYLQEHNDNIRTEAFALANFIITAENDEMYQHGIDLMRDPTQLAMMLDMEATERGLNEAVVYDSYTNKIIASGGLTSLQGKQLALPPKDATILARSNDVAILDSPDEHTVRAVVSLGPSSGLMLVITRPVDAKILEHMRHTNAVVAEYQRLNASRSAIQISFVLIFALLSFLVLTIGMLTGLVLANQIARPLSLLIVAARRVSLGDLSVQVPEGRQGRNLARNDEIEVLSRAFNQMTNQLSTQRRELMAAYDQINERRRFTEAVLSGVSAGVIGLDKQRVIKLPNRAASQLLHRDLNTNIGAPLGQSVPEFTTMLDIVNAAPGQPYMTEIVIDTVADDQTLGDGPRVGGPGRTLLVRVVVEQQGTDIAGYVVTFDDITALQAAQRKAAWADVARRIAHEIKNPLTPIQLSAERLKRKFLSEIVSDPQTFEQCVDTIVRRVGDIGRMVDEFSTFARMPQPILAEEYLSSILREALVLQRSAHPGIIFDTQKLINHGPKIWCDRRLIGQAVTNLLQNAVDAITARYALNDGINPSGNAPARICGHIVVAMTIRDKWALVTITDDGIGLPAKDRDRLTEPYVTHKPKGTGLGLAIVKKILDDHEGSLELIESSQGSGTVVTITLPIREAVN